MMFFYACIDFNNICAQLGIFRGMGNAANQLVTLDSGIIDVRHKNKVYNHPPPPLSPFLFFPPKPRSACRFSIWPRSTCEPVRRLGFWEQILGSLSRNDGDGYENVSLKVKSRCFKNVIALIPSRSIRQMLAIFVWIWILKIFIKVQEKKTKVVVVCSRPPQNVKFGILTSLSCSDGKEMYKIVWCTCKVVVLPN